MKIKKFNEFDKVNEEIFNENIEPSWIIIAAAWINLMSDGGINGIKKRLPGNLKSIKSDFIKFANWMGYTIDENMLDYRFNQMVDKIKDKFNKNNSNIEIDSNENKIIK